MRKTSFFYLIFLSLISLKISAQIVISGQVINRKTKQAVPYASVADKQSGTGTFTDFNGRFQFKTTSKHQTIIISCIGFETDTVDLTGKPSQNLILPITKTETAIDEVIIRAGENPAHILFRKIIKHKNKNNPKLLESYAYTQYTKTKLSLTNLSGSINGAESFKPDFRILYDVIDTSEFSGKAILPLMLSESVSDFNYRRHPKHQKEVIKAVKFAGFKNDDLAKYTGQMYVNINIYENYIKLFDKSFVSPIARTGLLTYEYYLTDSAFIENKWCYKMKFKARRKQEYTFNGYFWVADSSFAVKFIDVKISPDANINYFKDITIRQDFKAVNDSLFFLYEENFYAKFEMIKNSVAYSFSKTFTRKNIKINPSFPDEFFAITNPREIITADKASEKDTLFWIKNRPRKLNEKEQNIYIVADSIQKVPSFKFMKKLAYFGITGNISYKKLDFGPVLQTISQNEIEGQRLRFGLQTNNKFSTTIKFGGHIAYGLDDKQFKYGIFAKYRLKKTDWTVLKIYHRNDMTELGVMPYAFSDANFFSNAVLNTLNDNLFLTKSYEFGIEHQLFQGLTGELFFSHRNTKPSIYFPFTDINGNPTENLINTELVLNLHIALSEEYIDRHFTRTTLGTKFPILNINITQSLPDIWNNDFDYTKIELNFDHSFPIPPLGKLYYRIGGGKIWGTVPYPMLKLHPGNETIFIEAYTFNLMNIYEFASDKYLHLFIDHHFNGLICNKIPLVRKTKARSYISARSLIGQLSETNKTQFQFPTNLNSAEQPYIEFAAGIENIFNFFQIEAVRRLTHTDNPDIMTFGIRFAIVPNI